MWRRKKMASALIKSDYNRCLWHYEYQKIQTEWIKARSSCYPWSLHPHHPVEADRMGRLLTRQPLILDLLIFCHDWQMKGSVWTLNSGCSDTDRLKCSSNHTQTHEWLHSSMLDHIQSLFFTKVFYSSIIGSISFCTLMNISKVSHLLFCQSSIN